MFRAPGPAAPRWRSCSAALLLLAALLALPGCASLPRGIERVPSTAYTDDAASPLAPLIDASTPPDQRHLSGFRVLPTGEFSFDARTTLARRATLSLDVQYYQLHSDYIGHRFLRELRDAAQRGVRVRVLVDDFHTAGQDALLAEFAAHTNVQLRLFNPLPSRARSTGARVLASLHEFRRINHRMHNKLFIADGLAAVTGGRNIGDEYFMRSEAANFIDLDVLAVGAVVRELSAVFDRYWNSEHAYPAQGLLAPAGDAALARERFAERVRAVAGDLPVPPRDMFGRASVGAQLAGGRLDLHFAEAGVWVDSPDKVLGVVSPQTEGNVFSSSIRLMRTARSEVTMASPYFIPGERGVELMKEGIAAGIRLVVLTNALDAADQPLVHFAYSRYRHAMLRAGVIIYELGGTLAPRSNEFGVFRSSSGRLHAKVATVDRRWLIVGSMNLDERSRRANTEMSLVIDSPALTGEILGLIERRDRVAGAYKLRLADDGERIEWVAKDGDREVVITDEPGATALSRLWLWLLSNVIGEELL